MSCRQRLESSSEVAGANTKRYTIANLDVRCGSPQPQSDKSVQAVCMYLDGKDKVVGFAITYTNNKKEYLGGCKVLGLSGHNTNYGCDQADEFLNATNEGFITITITDNQSAGLRRDAILIRGRTLKGDMFFFQFADRPEE
jgi:hypothetical protein